MSPNGQMSPGQITHRHLLQNILWHAGSLNDYRNLMNVVWSLVNEIFLGFNSMINFQRANATGTIVAGTNELGVTCGLTLVSLK